MPSQARLSCVGFVEVFRAAGYLIFRFFIIFHRHTHRLLSFIHILIYFSCRDNLFLCPGKLKGGAKLPSVREMAENLKVNPNTDFDEEKSKTTPGVYET
jgi:hypothetical protein